MILHPSLDEATSGQSDGRVLRVPGLHIDPAHDRHDLQRDRAVHKVEVEVVRKHRVRRASLPEAYIINARLVVVIRRRAKRQRRACRGRDRDGARDGGKCCASGDGHHFIQQRADLHAHGIVRVVLRAFDVERQLIRAGLE